MAYIYIYMLYIYMYITYIHIYTYIIYIYIIHIYFTIFYIYIYIIHLYTYIYIYIYYTYIYKMYINLRAYTFMHVMQRICECVWMRGWACIMWNPALRCRVASRNTKCNAPQRSGIHLCMYLCMCTAMYVSM